MSKEITITFTADFTEVVKDKLNIKFIEANDPEDIRKALEQDMNANTNYDKIVVRDFKVFLGEEDNNG